MQIMSSSSFFIIIITHNNHLKSKDIYDYGGKSP